MPGQTKFSKSNASKYFVLVICILLTFVATLGLTLNLSNLTLLKSIKNIPTINRDFGRLNQSILELYDADNNCRMYIINGDRKYYEQFNSDLKTISLMLDTIEMLNRNEKPNNPEKFGYLIKQKKLRTSQFIRLKKLADSLITFSSERQEIITSSLPKERLFSTRQFKNIIQIDTLHLAVQAKTKKKFLGRIHLGMMNNKVYLMKYLIIIC